MARDSIKQKRTPILFSATTAIVACLALLSCQGRFRDERPADTVRFKVPVSTKAGVSMKTVELVSVDDTVWLSGWAAQILVSPFEQNGELVGQRARIQTFRNSQGDYIAQNDISLQMMTLYANQEKLFFLDKDAGVLSAITKLEQMTGQKIPSNWPRKIGVNTKIPTFKTDTQFELNGARYVGKYDAILFSPFALNSLNLTLNSGVIAHEHFHSIFRKLFLERISDKKPETDQLSDSDFWNPHFNFKSKNIKPTKNDRGHYHEVVLRGINEGLADVWGWIYSGDNDFVARTLGQTQDFRKLDPTKQNTMWSREELMALVARADSGKAAGLSQIPYVFGSQLANRLVKPFMESKRPRAEVQLMLGQAIIQALIEFSADFRLTAETEFYDPEKLVQSIQDQTEDFKW